MLVNSLRPGHDGCQFPDDIFKYIFLNENVRISIEISLKFVLKGPINNIPALVQIMAWRRPGDKPLSEPMMISLLTHICVTRPQWINSLRPDEAHYLMVLSKTVLTPVCWQQSCHSLALSHRYMPTKWIVIGLDNGFLPVWYQAIVWANDVILSIRPIGTSFSDFF